MSSLYELNSSIIELLENGFNLACVDEETGEIDEAKAAEYLEALQIDRTAKIENIAVYIKSLDSEAAAIKAEEKRLKERREAKERKAERMRDYLKSSMLLFNENRFETARVALSFRSSKTVVVSDIDKLAKEYIKEKVEYAADKTAIKKAIESGEIIDGAYIEEKQNLQIK